MTRARWPVVGRLAGPRPERGQDDDAGLTLAELLIVLALIVILITFTVPTTAATIDAGRINQAANAMASRFRLARLEAVARAHSVAVVFDQPQGRWTLRVCEDGNGNGIRRADIASGTDRCPEGPIDVEAMFPGVHVEVDPGLRGPAGEPGSPDPVRFGASNIASFSSLGSGTSGTLFLRSPLGAQYAVRIAGASGRTRVLRYDRASRSWMDV
jgi:prepilin-type N-terminal cleavage/methylation domain-containing protein